MSPSSYLKNFSKQTLDRLYSLVDNAKRKEFLHNNREFKLDSIIALLEKLDNPQNKFKIIHVAGTKGKGSCVHYLSAMLKEKKNRTGHFLSPQILDERDRFYIDQQKSSWSDIIYWFDLILNLTERENLTVTVFDIFTATAFCLFAQKKVEWAVIETGLGGRLDSTNVVDPVVTMITKIGLDHTEILGDTILKIAKEKAGIVKPHKPLFFQLAPAKENIAELFQKICQEKNSDCFAIAEDHPFFINLTQATSNTSAAQNKATKNLVAQLFSPGQKSNLALCLAVMEHLQMPLTQTELETILLKYPLLARKQQFENILLDGAHNQVSIKDLVTYIKYQAILKRYTKIHLFFTYNQIKI